MGDRFKTSRGDRLPPSIKLIVINQPNTQPLALDPRGRYRATLHSVLTHPTAEVFDRQL